MTIRNVLIQLSVMLLGAVPAWAVDYSVKPLEEGPPRDELSAEVAGLIQDQGVRVVRGAATTYCDIWFCKTLPTVEGFKATSELLYPFTPGQLVGVARFARKGADFRDQDIDPGVYTLRYAQQPVDGAHVGTSPTRDFLLLSKAEADKMPAVLDYKSLTQNSAEAAGSSHPAMICLQTVAPDVAEFPSIRHDEQHDWWIAAVRTPAQAGGKPLAMGIVVVGLAPEQ